MSGPVRLWVEVGSRAELDGARRTTSAATFVVPAGTPVYGRPGDELCVSFAEGDLRTDRATIAARLPVRAGGLVPASTGGLAMLGELRGRGRRPLAVSVASVADARLGIDAGATDLLLDAAAISPPLRDAASAAGVALIVRIGTVADAQAALGAGADGLVVPARTLPDLVDAPGLAPSLAPPPTAVREATGPTPPPGAAGRSVPRQATIAAILDRAARLNPSNAAIVHHASGTRRSYAQLRSDARRLARALIAGGVTPGERVVIWARNQAEWPVVQLGVATAGAILVTANPGLSDEEIEFIVAQSGAVAMFAGPHPGPRAALLDRMARHAGAGDVRTVVALPGTRVDSAPVARWEAFLESASRVAEREVDRVAARIQPDDVATILYTSGTTGFPKGAQLTHRGMLQNAAAVGANLGVGPNDRIVLPVPFHHCFGAVMGTLAAVTYGATLVLPSDGFDAGAALSAIEAERGTVVYGVPTMFAALLDHPARSTTTLTSLRAGIAAGSPVPLDLARRIERDLHVSGLVIAYGLTEASPVVTQTTPSDPERVRLGTVGRAIVGAEVRAVDPETGRPVAPGTTGELVTRGPMVMRGYFDMPDETNDAIDRDGWLHTGDLAVQDSTGAWSIVGRLKDMIIRGGENIYPAEIEAVGRRLEGVRDIQVVGVPSDYFGEEVFAWVEPAPGARLTEDAVRAHLGEHLARFQVPAHVRFTEAWPLTGSGKVRKSVLREHAIAALAGTGTDLGLGPTGQTTTDSSSGDPAGPRTKPDLPLLAPKRSLLGGPTSSSDAGTPRVTGESFGPPIGDQQRDDPERDPARPGRRSATAPPYPGWSRPERPGWRWQPRRPIPEPSSTEEGNVSLDDVRQRGQRIKTWGIGGNVREQIESTGEEPIMYKALGTPPQTRHPFNLYGDIRSQPEALRGTFEHANEIEQVARTLAERDISGVIGLGSGTSQFVAQVANAAFARFAAIPGWDYDSQAFLRYPPPLEYGRLLAVAYSGSGSTVDTVAAARDCRTRGAYTLSVTSVEGSPVVQATDARILTAGGFDTGGSDTFHYTTRIAAAIYLALEIGRLRNPHAHDFDALKRTLLDTPRRMAEMFDAVDRRCRTIADMFLGVRSVLVVGAGANFGTAEEIALKFDEMAHIPAKSMNPGRHIHGALGLTEESILTILVAPPGIAYKDLHDIAKVTQLLKSPAIAIVSDEDQEIADIVDYVVRIPVEDEVLFSVLAVLPGQLLPYWSGVGLGLNPDTQRSNVPKHARVWNMLFPPGTH